MRGSRTATLLNPNRGGASASPHHKEQPMTIVNNLRFKTLGSDMNEGVVVGSITQNNIPVLEENYVAKMNANNGFSKKRLFRRIASIPDVANLKAYQDGYNLDDVKDLRRFLSDNPEYMTVDKIDTGASGHIIIK
jgi:hypothetical protein